MEQTTTLLIVDDEPAGRETLAALLHRDAYPLVFAGDGPAALAWAAEVHLDVVLLDVMMPGMDGCEVCRRMRADPVLAEVPIVRVTALDGQSARLVGIEAGADDFITKPYDRVELRAHPHDRAAKPLPPIVETLGRVLGDLYTVFATSGDEALDILAREEIAVIIADQRMPGLTGVQLLERAKHIKPNTLGILSSAYFDNAALSDALNLGTVRGYIHKPWNLTDLRRRVNEVVQQYRSVRHQGSEFTSRAILGGINDQRVA